MVSAVECAAEVQRELAGRNRSLPDARKMHFRIGINLGEVMIEPDADVYGDGVNVAARLQELAEPGGICISGPVYDLVRGRLVIGFDYLGEQRVKNISSDVPVYRVMLDGREAGAPAARARTRPKEQSLGERRRRFEWSALRIGVIILGSFSSIWRPTRAICGSCSPRSRSSAWCSSGVRPIRARRLPTLVADAGRDRAQRGRGVTPPPDPELRILD